jgi:signal transduction histidine kinase
MTRRLLLSYLTFALLILVGLEVPLGYGQQRNEQHEAFQQLEHDAEVLAVFVDSDLSSNDMAQIDMLAHESAQRLGGQVDVVNAQGDLLSSTHQPTNVSAFASEIRAVLSGQGRISTRTTLSGGVEMMSVVVSVHPGLAPHGAIRVSVPTEAMIGACVERFRLILVGIGLLVLAAAAAMAFALARWISRPVRALEQATRTLADATSPPPLPTTSGPPELRRLATTFAATADRLHGLIASQRSFIGHASHQLKTPLAALRLRLENLEPDIAAAGHSNLQAALTETDRLAQMVESLLTMARCEQNTLPRERIGLAEAVAERISFWTPLAASHAVRISASGPDDAHVQAIPAAVDQILDNLLSNALRAAPHGSTITVTWQSAPHTDGTPMMELHVIDNGPGLTAQQRARALDPFWRAPGMAKDGTGLGLALVRKLAEVSGGHATLKPGHPVGIDAVVALPAAPGSTRHTVDPPATWMPDGAQAPADRSAVKGSARRQPSPSGSRWHALSGHDC